MAQPEIPKTHKAVVYDKPGEISLKIQDVETPEPGHNEVLIRLTHTGVCHSDLSIMKASKSWALLPYPTPPGQIGGHEGVGEVVKLGPGMEGSSLKIGSRVGVKWVQYACSQCPACLEGVDGCCFKVKVSGYYSPGTFQQYVTSPGHYVTPIPDGVPSDVAAPMLCAGLTVYSALKRSLAKPGDWVVISGAGGGLGHIACQIGSRGLGYRIIAIDSSDKESFTLSCGASHFLSIQNYPRDDEGSAKLTADVKALTGGIGAAASIVCTSSNAAYAQALTFLRRFNGVLVAVGLPEGTPQPIPGVHPISLVGGQVTVTAAAVGNRREAIEVLNLISNSSANEIRPKFTTHSMEELANGEIFRKMEKGELLGRAVVVLD